MGTSYHLDTMIKVDESLCIHCGACIRTCPAGLITKMDFPIPIEIGWDKCIDCGHCVAVCPTGAMHQRAMGPEDCAPIDIHLIPRWEEARQFLVSRRSVRVYINKPLEKEKILQMLDVARLAPSGGNRQGDILRWVVVSDPAQVHQVAQMTIDWMKSVRDSNPAMYEEAKLEIFTNAWDEGDDQIARGAPCFIQAWAPKDERTAPQAATIALAYTQLAAHALGLGSSWSGGYQHRRAGVPSLDRASGTAGRHCVLRNNPARVPRRNVPADPKTPAPRRELALSTRRIP